MCLKLVDRFRLKALQFYDKRPARLDWRTDVKHLKLFILASLIFVSLIGCARIQVGDKSFPSGTPSGLNKAGAYVQTLFKEQIIAIRRMKMPRTGKSLLIHYPGWLETAKENDRLVGLGGGAGYCGFMEGMSVGDYNLTTAAMVASGLFSHTKLEESPNVSLRAEQGEYEYYMTRNRSPGQVSWTIVHTKSGASKRILVPNFTGYAMLVREVHDFVKSVDVASD